MLCVASARAVTAAPNRLRAYHLTLCHAAHTQAVKAFVPTLYRLREGGGISKVSKGTPPINKLLPDGVFLFDTGFELFIWVGKEAPRAEKTSAFIFTQGYLKKYKRPPVLPITRYGEGQESTAFKAFFGPPVQEGCCVVS